MFLTMFLIDFFHEDWSARCFELRSQDEPFRVQARDYRPLSAGASGLNIGAAAVSGGGWDVRLDNSCDPVNRWLARSDERVEFEIEYSGVIPPMTGNGAYNLVLPYGWRFIGIQVENPYYSTPPGYQVARDDEGDREALMLDFQGANIRFKLAIQAARGSRESDSHDLDVSVYSRRIVEPSAVPSRAELAAIHEVLSYWETGTRLRILTHMTDLDYPGLVSSLKTWRTRCQAALTVLPPGAQRDMVRDAQKAVIPVEILLNRILSGNNGSSENKLAKAIEDMQEKIEIQVQALAKSVGESLGPRERERDQ